MHPTQRVITSFLQRKSRYRYSPLKENQIRLLKLHPGDADTPIRCSLQAVDLLAYDDHAAESSIEGWERFDTISYVWGNPSHKVEISCDDETAHITVNLADALQKFRDPLHPQVLWADALCINQKDNDERAAQVKLMGLIYFKARRVRVWLGREEKSVEGFRVCDAVQLIRHYARLYEACRSDSSGEEHRLCSESLLKEPGSPSSSNWTAMQELLERPWFTRVWVVQELGLSRDAVFYCEESQFNRREINYLKRLLSYSTTGMMVSAKLDMRMLQLGNNYWNLTWGNGRIEHGSDPQDAETFLDILRTARGLHCTDPRDIVYAFLGHPSAFKRQLLDVDARHWYPINYYTGRSTIVVPDYHKSNTFPKLCRQVAITATTNLDIGLDVLSHVAHDQVTIEANYPSWVPQWNITGHPTDFSGSKKYFAASGLLSETDFELSSTTKKAGLDQLSFRALHLDDIRHVWRVPLLDRLLEEFPNAMADLLGDAPRMGRSSAIPPPNPATYPYQEPFVFAFASTMTAGLTSAFNKYAEPADEHESQHVRNFHAYYRYQQSPHPDKHSAQDLEHAGYFSIDLTRESVGKSFFLTFDGRFGLGPYIMNTGEEIWLPMGAKMPVILRPCGNGTYKVIGQTYLHGVMRGEAVEGKSEEDFETVILI